MIKRKAKKYKANEKYKDLKDKYFQYGTQKTLLRGGILELKDSKYKILPDEVKKALEPLDKPKQTKVSKPDTKKKDRKGDK